MASKHKRRLSGLAAPVFACEPLLLRLCSGFVSNLTLILRTAFIIGYIPHDEPILLTRLTD